jgi:hypothetical protein
LHTRKHLIGKDKYKFVKKTLKQIFQRNGAPNKLDYLYSYLTKQTSKENTEETKKGYFMLVTGTIHQDDVTIVNICAPNSSTPSFLK